MRCVKGTPGSAGLAIGPAFVLVKEPPKVDRLVVEDPEPEVERLDAALETARQAIQAIRTLTAKRMGEAEAQVFDAHLLFLEDPSLVDEARDRIRAENLCAEWAFQEVGGSLAGALAELDDPYLRERAADVRDVVERVLCTLLGRAVPGLHGIAEPSVVVATDLTPSETAQLNPELVLGFATDVGGPTSHSAIMARTLGIPAVVGTGTVTEAVHSGDQVVLDGDVGTVVIRPDAAELQQTQERIVRLERRKQRLEQLVCEPAVTVDGHRVEMAANIGKPGDVAGALRWGAEGVGLFRTEFLYMDRGTLPSEEEQLAAYRTVLEQMGPTRPVIIRTLDIGGDKQLEALPLPVEANPFLGLRAIRLCLDRKDLFRTQLRALLRAAAYGRVRIMYPMIQSLSEVRQANALLAEARAELVDEGVAVGDPEVGIMVEIPAAAATADLLAPHVDFFSIGTNDLIQYTIAVDRMNERVSHLYEPLHPAVLRLIHQVCRAARQAGKWTGMCGEMARDAVVAPVLLGLGLDEWSMSAPALPAVKEALRAVRRSEAEEFAASLLTVADPSELRRRAEEFYRSHVGQP